MAHNLKSNADGKKAMIYNEEGGRPWHSLGTPVHGAMSVEVAQQVFPFTYRKEALHRPDGTVITTHDSIVISDTNKVMGIGGVNTTILQPTEVAEFAVDLLEEGVLCETAGALGDGERIWMLLHSPDYKFEVVKGDEHRQYVLVTNAYDYSAAMEARYTDVRVVCQNTVNQAVAGSPACVKLRHTSGMKTRMAMAAEIFRGYVKANASFREAMEYLAKHPINDALITEFEHQMFGDVSKTAPGRSTSILTNKLQKFEELLMTGKGTEIKGVVGTAYGMFNAFTEFQDWHSRVVGDDRTNSILFGQASKEKVKALDLVLALTK